MNTSPISNLLRARRWYRYMWRATWLNGFPINWYERTALDAVDWAER